MKISLRGFTAGVLLAGVTLAAEAEPIVIREITFEGNLITQPVTMLRELVVAVGDEADPERIERSRQAIQDLGLFREVKVRQESLDEGTRVVFTVREKWYVIPIPRLEVNSDGDTGYGLQLRWNNLWGLNHRLEFLGVQRHSTREDRDDSLNLSSNYNIPFLGQSRNALNISGDHVEQDSTSEAGVDYRERIEHAGFVVSRSLNAGPASQGWSVGGGLSWQDQQTRGENAPASFGMAIGPVASLSYNDRHDYIYSETGETFSSAIGVAGSGLGSDYSYFSHFTSYSDQIHVGQLEHQTLRFSAEVGGYHAGPASREPKAFQYGGSTRLRGYDREIIEGDFAYYAAVDYLRPIGRKSIRLLTQLEVGSALDDLRHPGGRLLYSSVAVGATFRITWLVNVEFEIGVAYPLVDGDGLRIYARAI